MPRPRTRPSWKKPGWADPLRKPGSRYRQLPASGPGMRFDPNIRLDPSQVEDYRPGRYRRLGSEVERAARATEIRARRLERNSAAKYRDVIENVDFIGRKRRPRRGKV